MPTLTSTLKLFDRFSSPMGNVIAMMERADAVAARLSSRSLFAGFGNDLASANTRLAALNATAVRVSSTVGNIDARLATMGANAASSSAQVQASLGRIESALSAIGATGAQTNAQLTGYLARFSDQLDQVNAQLGGMSARMDNVLNAAAKSGNSFKTSFTGARMSLGSFAAALASVYVIARALQGVGELFTIPDEMITRRARLSLINDGLVSDADLKQKIFDSAMRSRVAYTDMVDMVSRVATTSPQVPTSTVSAMAEAVSKSLKIGGATEQETRSVMLQLTQALGSGRLQGDEFRSLAENAPYLMRQMAEGIGVAVGELKNMSTEGELTSDVIANAVLSRVDQINADFQTLPVTFGDIGTAWTNIWGMVLDGMSQAGGPLDTLNQKLQEAIVWLQTPAGQEFVSGIADFATDLINGVTSALEGLGALIGWIGANADTLVPALLAVEAAIIAINIAQMVSQLIAMGWAGLIVAAIALVLGALTFLILRFEGVRTAVSYVVAYFVTAWKIAVGNVVTIFEWFANIVIGIINLILGALGKAKIEYLHWGQDLLVDTVTNLPERFTETQQSVKGGLDTAAGWTQNISDIVSKLKNPFDNTGKGYNEYFSDITKDTGDVAEWTGGGAGGGVGDGGGAPVTVTNDTLELSESDKEALRALSVGAALRQVYLNVTAPVSVSDNTFKNEQNFNPDDIGERMGRSIMESVRTAAAGSYAGLGL